MELCNTCCTSAQAHSGVKRTATANSGGTTEWPGQSSGAGQSGGVGQSAWGREVGLERSEEGWSDRGGVGRSSSGGQSARSRAAGNTRGRT